MSIGIFHAVECVDVQKNQTNRHNGLFVQTNYKITNKLQI